jgi:hypothetical protein
MKKLRRIDKRPLVLVTWRDAHSDMRVRPHKSFFMHTVGWVVKAGPRWTTLAGEQGKWALGRYRGYTRIPTANVVSIRRLK